jgi:hypothetical protein
MKFVVMAGVAIVVPFILGNDACLPRLTNEAAKHATAARSKSQALNRKSTG